MKEIVFPIKQSNDKLENDSNLPEESSLTKPECETSLKKNKDLYFVNHFRLTKNTFSSSQIEGKCLRNLSETHEQGRAFPGVFNGIHHFNTHEELPQVFAPSSKDMHPLLGNLNFIFLSSKIYRN